jgi:hypothetical protein
LAVGWGVVAGRVAAAGGRLVVLRAWLAAWLLGCA